MSIRMLYKLILRQFIEQFDQKLLHRTKFQLLKCLSFNKFEIVLNKHVDCGWYSNWIQMFCILYGIWLNPTFRMVAFYVDVDVVLQMLYNVQVQQYSLVIAYCLPLFLLLAACLVKKENIEHNSTQFYTDWTYIHRIVMQWHSIFGSVCYE